MYVGYVAAGATGLIGGGAGQCSFFCIMLIKLHVAHETKFSGP